MSRTRPYDYVRAPCGDRPRLDEKFGREPRKSHREARSAERSKRGGKRGGMFVTRSKLIPIARSRAIGRQSDHPKATIGSPYGATFRRSSTFAKRISTMYLRMKTSGNGDRKRAIGIVAERAIPLPRLRHSSRAAWPRYHIPRLTLSSRARYISFLSSWIFRHGTRYGYIRPGVGTYFCHFQTS